MNLSSPGLPRDVVKLLKAGHGVVSVDAAERGGITRARLARLASGGRLVRLARGVYACSETYMAATQWHAFELRTRAFTAACGPHAVAGGWSAGAVWRLPSISPPPERPLALVPQGLGSACNSRYGVVRAVPLPVNHRVVVNGCAVTPLPRTVVDISRTSPRDDALVAADAALTGRMTLQSLRSVVELESGWPGATRAAWVVEHADPYSESALETLGRLTCIEYDLPVPLSNVWVDARGSAFRVDHLLDGRWLVFEGDGALKYDNRADAGRVVAQQREREWRLREAGLTVARYDWRLARHDRPRLAERFAGMIAECPARAETFPWKRDDRTRSRVVVSRHVVVSRNANRGSEGSQRDESQGRDDGQAQQT